VADDRRNWTTPPVEGSATVFGMYGTRTPLLVS
jgi:hypothetical protein